MNYKYPKTHHFPWSPGLTDDDRVISNDNMFGGMEVVVSVKMDGENTAMTNKSCHARSLDSKDHHSRHWIKQFWSTIRNDIPDNIKIFGENLYAKHSIKYEELESYFYVFGVLEGDTFLSWNDMEIYAQELNLKIVPVLYKGVYNVDIVKSCYGLRQFLGGEQEGYVCRNVDSFKYKDFSDNVAKFVRKNHVQTSEHWMNEKMIVNGVKK